MNEIFRGLRVSGAELWGRDANEELSGRLRRAMTAQSLTQSLLARNAELSAAAVSNALNAEKGPPSVHSLKQLALALGVPGDELAEWTDLRDRATRNPPRPVPATAPAGRFDRYLAAAGRAALEDPYAGILPGVIPPLAGVHLRQQARLTGHSAPHARGATELPYDGGAVPAEQILLRGESGIVSAGPGGGKTTLLRTHLAAAVGRLRTMQVVASIPVLVPAAALTGLPLTQAIAEGATAMLAPHGLPDRLPTAFFRKQPKPGMAWLVMVDGLDEITDTRTRRRLLQTLSQAMHGDEELYRVLVTTRPLPAEELDDLGDQVPHYELQALGTKDLPDFACRWFEALQLPDPDSDAVRFIGALDRSGLLDLARTPLMSTMLCQLYAADPGGELPRGRGAIFRRFVDLLHERQHGWDSSSVTEQTRIMLARYGPDALAMGQRTLDHLPTLVTYLAAQQYEGKEEPVPEALASQPEAARPARVPKRVWADFLTEAVRRSGLLTLQSGRFTFSHQTLREYLAARHTVHDADAARRVLSGLLDNGWSRPRPWARRIWSLPSSIKDSYGGFLLDICAELGVDTAPVLHRLAAHGGTDGCFFVLRQANLGTLVPERVIAAATESLASFVHNAPASIDPFEFFAAARELAETGDPRGLDALAATADIGLGRNAIQRWLLPRLRHLYDATRVTDSFIRMASARELARLGDPRGRSLLIELLEHPTHLDFADRYEVAGHLAELGVHHAPEILAAQAHDPELDGRYRIEAAHALTELEDQRGLAALLSCVADSGRAGAERVEAALRITMVRQHRRDGWNTMAALTNDLTLDGRHRVDAAWHLVQRNDTRGEDALVTLSNDRALSASARWRAIRGLNRLGIPWPSDKP
ncbi:helix-turn-helix domain-containing protein [Streptomyces sp. NPDC047971]|uniref:helix-turn-helix domain-containing protein n=1 Tax=Streptomyces sp. NPDC047971 TaxID=3154499 RepID=UPI003401DF93